MLSIQELRSSSKKELQPELQKARATLLKVRISLKTKHEKDTSKSRKAKAYIAQILTMLKQLEKGPSSAKATEAVAKSEVPAAKEVVAKPAKSETKKSATKKVVKKNS